MNKNDMDNETKNKTSAMNQGTSGGGGQAKGPGSGQGKGSVGGGGQGAGAAAAPSGQKTQGGAGQGEGVLEQVQESGRDIASKSLSALSEKTKATTEGYKAELTSGLHTLADGLRQTSSNFRSSDGENALASAGARYIGDLANKIESVSGYFERKDASDLLRDVKGFAKRNPTVFVGGAFALGFALSRVIRSGVSASSGAAGNGGNSSRALQGGSGNLSPALGSGSGSMRTGADSMRSDSGSLPRGGSANSPMGG